MISRFFNNVMRAVKGAPLWVKAFDQISNKDWEGAILTLNAYSKFPPKGDPQYFIAVALVQYNLGEFDQSLKSIGVARDRVFKSSKYSFSEKNYLHCYLDRLAEKLVSYGDEQEFYGDFSSLKLNEVNKVLQHNFPL